MGFIINLIKEGAKLIGFKVVESVARSLVKGKPHVMAPAEQEEVIRLKRELEICRKDLERCASEKQALIEKLDETERRLQFVWLWAAISTVSAIVLAIILLWR